MRGAGGLTGPADEDVGLQMFLAARDWPGHVGDPFESLSFDSIDAGDDSVALADAADGWGAAAAFAGPADGAGPASAALRPRPDSDGDAMPEATEGGEAWMQCLDLLDSDTPPAPAPIPQPQQHQQQTYHHRHHQEQHLQQHLQHQQHQHQHQHQHPVPTSAAHRPPLAAIDARANVPPATPPKRGAKDAEGGWAAGGRLAPRVVKSRCA